MNKNQKIELTEDEINAKKKAAAKRARQNRKERDEVMKSCGLTKVRGAVSGKIYWE